MKTSYYRKIDAMSLAVVDLTDHPDQGLIITRINVPHRHRGKGIASELLREVCSDADKSGTTLRLEISPSDGLNFSDLEKWYERHGFEGPGTGIMCREPKST